MYFHNTGRRSSPREYCTLMRGAGWPVQFFEIHFVMAKSYQLVAWTEKDQVRMIPSEVSDYIHAELQVIGRMTDSIRYYSVHERQDIIRLSQAHEKLAVGLFRLGRIEEAFGQYAQAARCCLCGSEWQDTEWGEILCKPLRGRFFAMFCTCKDMVREYPRLKYNWDKSELRSSFSYVTYPFHCFEINWGHDFACTRNTIRETGTRGLTVGGHIIIGLPGETRQMLLQEAEILNTLPLDYLKFHQLQILRGTPMEAEYKKRPGDFLRPGPQEYIDLLAELITRLRPDIAIARIAGSVPPSFTDAPWGLLRHDELMRRLIRRLEEMALQESSY